jgi:regulatory protein
VTKEGTVTDLQPTRTSGRMRVFVDEELFAEMPSRIVEELGLAVGQRLLPDELQRIRQAAEDSAARQAAVKALGRRARTRRGLEQILEGKGFTPEAITTVLDWLTDHGYVNDEQYATERLSALRQRGLGARAIHYKLIAEGVPEKLAAAVVGQQAEELHETELACALARKQAARLASVPWLKRRQRLYQFLARRGFAGDVISEAINGLESPEGSSEESEEA